MYVVVLCIRGRKEKQNECDYEKEEPEEHGGLGMVFK